MSGVWCVIITAAGNLVRNVKISSSVKIISGHYIIAKHHSELREGPSGGEGEVQTVQKPRN